MTGIDPDIYSRLRRTLLKCDPFSSGPKLYAIFADARIAAWRAQLPEGDSQNARVNLVIDFLRDKVNARHDNALVLLLYVLCDQVARNDVCHDELQALIVDLEAMFKSNQGATLLEELLDPSSGIAQLILAVNTLVNDLHSVVDGRTDSGVSKPYKGLLAYEMSEADAFFGRDQSIQSLLSKLQNNKLIILHGESGTGKTSLLQAGVAPRLLKRGGVPVCVRVHKQSPVQGIKRAFVEDIEEFENLREASLHHFLHKICLAAGPDVPVYIFLDQFEDFFKFVESAEREKFVEQLAACIEDVKLNVSWVLSIRTESFGDLATFRPYIQHPFANDYHLSRLSIEQAAAVIAQLAARGGITFETGLVRKISEDLGQNEVLPAQLQLVCNMLVDTLGDRPDRLITCAMYQEEAGGASGILQNYLDRVLSEEMAPDKRKGAWLLIKECLVTFDAHRTLCSYSRIIAKMQPYALSSTAIQEILDCLINSRLIQVQQLGAPEGQVAYELAHDYLLSQIQLTPEDETRKRVEEILEQTEDNWRRGTRILLDARTLGELLEPQAEHLGLTDTQVQILIRSAVASRRPIALWVNRLSPAALESLTAALSEECHARNREIKRDAFVGLWALRKSLPRSLLWPVYSHQVWYRVRRPLLIMLLLLFIPMGVWGVLGISTPFTASWQVMDLRGVVQGGKTIAGVSKVAVNPVDPDDVYVVDAGHHQLYRRLEVRAWVEVDNSEWHKSAIHDLDVVASHVYVVTDDGIFHSQNAGVTWEPVEVILETHPITLVNALAASPSAPEQLFVGAPDVGVLYLSNGGTRWRVLDAPPAMNMASLHALVANDRFLLVAAGQQIWLAETPDFALKPLLFSGCEIPTDAWINSLTLPYPSQKSILAGIQGDGICDGNISSPEWRTLDTPFANSVLDVAIVASHYYVAGKEGLWCQRTWDSSESMWWRARLHSPQWFPVPCRDE